MDKPRKSLLKALCNPADIASLVWFRVAFGLIMLVEAWRYLSKGRAVSYYTEQAFHFKYYGFSWVKEWSEWGMQAHFIVLGMAGLCMALGLMYRLAAVVLFFGFTYVYLLDQAHYLNHHYLVCLFCFLMMWLPANRAFAMDSWLRPAIRTNVAPAWALWLPRAQLGIVYFMAGVAKINADWLDGEPMRTWLLRRTDYAVLGPFFAEPWTPYLFSYGGLLFDLMVAPMLIWRRTRLLAFILAALFNLTNGWLFSIGIFPWMAFGATVILFQPGLPKPFPRWWQPASGPAPAIPMGAGLSRRQKLAASLTLVYIALQLLIPLRHWLYPGNVAWTEQGHRFSWRMMLRKKSGDLAIQVHDPASGESWNVFPREYLTLRQHAKACTRPDMILQLCHHIAKDMADRGLPGVEVRAVAMVSLNGRTPQPLVDPEVDLAAQPRNLWHSTWIMPFNNEPLRHRLPPAAPGIPEAGRIGGRDDSQPLETDP